MVTIDDHRYGALSAGRFEHALHGGSVGLDVEIVHLTVGMGLTGLRGVGSAGFAVNLNVLSHERIVSDEASNVRQIPFREAQRFGRPGYVVDVFGLRAACGWIPKHVGDRR